MLRNPVTRVVLGLFIVTAILAAAPWWASRADLRLISEFMSYLALAVLWNLLAGYAGLVSVGSENRDSILSPPRSTVRMVALCGAVRSATSR